MNRKTCFFIGHRDTPESVMPVLADAVERHIARYGVTEFIVGSRGAFDRLATRALQCAKQRHPEIRLTLLLAYYIPYKTEALPPGFDETLYPDGMERVPRRAAIVRANRRAIELCDHLIAYDAGRVGNTGALVRFARRRESRGLLTVENLYDIS